MGNSTFERSLLRTEDLYTYREKRDERSAWVARRREIIKYKNKESESVPRNQKRNLGDFKLLLKKKREKYITRRRRRTYKRGYFESSWTFLCNSFITQICVINLLIRFSPCLHHNIVNISFTTDFTYII